MAAKLNYTKEDHEAWLALSPAEKKAKKLAALPPEFKGAKKYIVGPERAFFHDRVYSEGEVITLVDTVPSKTFKPYDAEAAAAPAAAKAEAPAAHAAPKRPSDKAI